MATDEWLEFGGTEIVNLSRTIQLAEALGVDALWYTPESVEWVEEALSGSGEDYSDITQAPWYDAGYPASAEFAGIVSLGVTGLGDSTREATTIEYVTDGGNSSKPRNKTLPMVANMVLVGSTERGVEYGKRWLNRVLRGAGTKMFCSGDDLHYFENAPTEAGETPPVLHYRDVSVTRAVSVTRKRVNDCTSLLWVTFTWTANDPFEYGEPLVQFADLGDAGGPVGPGVDTSGQLDLTELACPVYDYKPVYDPLYPALVAPPTVPDFLPDGWFIEDGLDFTRYWARLDAIEPSHLNVVPMLTLTTDSEARMIRFSVWPNDADPSDLCGWLWSAVVSYLPANQQFIIDGEQEAAYVWDGASPLVRRSDSLVYGPEAYPLDWAAFNDPMGLLVSLDVFDTSGGDVRAALSVVPKSD